MCGIAGLFNARESLTDRELVMQSMVQSLQHRGPNSHGVWSDDKVGVTFGHARLSILDLSPAGHQPMLSRSGRYVVSYNGEIYNFAQIKTELQGPWNGSSDTEVLLSALEAWGLEQTLKQIQGMYAFSIWDRQLKTLTLVRDRLGEKPLYFGWHQGSFVFASELKAFKRLPAWKPEIDLEALASFFKLNHVPAPQCIFKNFFKLLPAHFVVIDLANPKSALEQKPYWSLKNFLQGAPAILPKDQGKSKVQAALQNAVASQMISDVPLGAFLSGGIDSSLIVALMSRVAEKKVQTFTIGFTEKAYDESRFARAVAQHLKTEHHEVILKPSEVLDRIPDLATIYDEPFADSSQLPTTLLCQLAGKAVRVALSGDGGDEVFGGYNRYLWTKKILAATQMIPRSLRLTLKAALTGPHLVLLERFFGKAQLAKLQNRVRQFEKLGPLLDYSSKFDLYDRFLSHRGPHLLPSGTQDFEKARWEGRDFVEWMMWHDTTHYLPNDILVKVDRAAMASSLETRAPFLDLSVIETAWRLPLESKMRGAQGKLVLREILREFVPDSLFERPKMGFGIPLGHWLRADLRDWCARLLSPEALAKHGLLDTAVVARMWKEHLNGTCNWEHQLWDILMFQEWYQRWM